MVTGTEFAPESKFSVELLLSFTRIATDKLFILPCCSGSIDPYKTCIGARWHHYAPASLHIVLFY